MKVLVVIHPPLRGKLWCYDIMYKESLIDRIFRRKLKLERDEYEYEAPQCPYVEKYASKGWSYFISGDTDHSVYYFKETGIKDKTDLVGLVSYLKSRFKNAEIALEVEP